MRVPAFGPGRPRSMGLLASGFLLLVVVGACSSSVAGASSPLNALGPAGSFAVLHARLTVTGGLAVTGSYGDQLTVATCAAVAAHGTNPRTVDNPDLFYVPTPPLGSGVAGSVGGSNSFTPEVAATYKGPGSYSGSQLTGTEIWVDPIAGDQETHNFAPVAGLGSMTVNADASGSYDFSGWQDPGSVTISGTVTWTCSDLVSAGRPQIRRPHIPTSTRRVAPKRSRSGATLTRPPRARERQRGPVCANDTRPTACVGPGCQAGRAPAGPYGWYSSAEARSAEPS